jgi:hypothetical protein
VTAAGAVWLEGRSERADRRVDHDGSEVGGGGADESEPATSATTADAVVRAGPPDQATLDAVSLRLEPLVALKWQTRPIASIRPRQPRVIA